jgi:WD40 repeat protein
VGGALGEYVIGRDGEDVALWDMTSGKSLAKSSGHTRGIVGIAVHPIRPWEFISYSFDSSFILWNIGTAENRAQERVNEAHVNQEVVDRLLRGEQERAQLVQSVLP